MSPPPTPPSAMGEYAPVIARRGIHNLLTMLTGHAATVVVMAVSSFVIPRFLGSPSYGLYAAAMAVVGILMTASTLGLPQVGTRYLAPAWRLQERRRVIPLASAIWTARQASALVAGLVAVVWLGMSPSLAAGWAGALLLGLLCWLRVAHEATRMHFLFLDEVGKMVRFDVLRATLSLPVVVVLYLGFGLTGVYTGLALLYAALLGAGTWLLLRIAPLEVDWRHWSALRPHLSFGSSTYAGTLAGMVQVHFAVYAVAVWMAPAEAGILAVAVQLYRLARNVILSGHRALAPILSELEDLGERQRLREWGGLMLRWGAAATSLTAIVWALVGRDLVELLLTDAFAPVFPCVSAILVAVVFFCCAANCSTLLYVLGLAGLGGICAAIYAGATIGGLSWVLSSGAPAASLGVAWVYAGAAMIYWAACYTALGLGGGLWLPLRRTLLLILPAALLWPAIPWPATLAVRVGLLAVLSLLYLGAAVGLRLLPAAEVRRLFRALRAGRVGRLPLGEISRDPPEEEPAG